MERPLLNRRHAIIVAVVTAVIVYGSLYPFAFRVPATDVGPVRALLDAWATRPGRGDFVSNILLYMPFGYFGFLALGDRLSAWRRCAIVVLAGALLSFTMELTQYYDAGRQTTFSDLYTNTLGAALGSISALLIAGRFRRPLLRNLSENRDATLLIAGWLGYRLFPYVPTIDLHKYWHALRPILLHPATTAYDLGRHTVIWLAIYTLLAAILQGRRVLPSLVLFTGSVLLARTIMIGTILSVAEVTGAAVALGLWLTLGSVGRLRLSVVMIAFLAMVAAQRLEPFRFGFPARHFGWIPFYSLMHGSTEVDIRSFFEKFFLYGTSIWLLVRVGIRLGVAGASVAALLLATSVAQIYLPGRSGEITDAVMALMIAFIAGLSRQPESRPPVPRSHHRRS